MALRAMAVAAGIVDDQRMAARRILAARDMPAERRRAAALDRAHRLRLVDAHMATIGRAPRGTVVAEDVRELRTVEPLPTALSRRQLLEVPRRLPVARRDQARDRALDLGDESRRHACVARRRVQLLVSEQRLDQPDVLAVLEQMGGEGMTQRSDPCGLSTARRE